jgi:hypothetical protein
LAFGEEEFLDALAMTISKVFFNKLQVIYPRVLVADKAVSA